MRSQKLDVEEGEKIYRGLENDVEYHVIHGNVRIKVLMSPELEPLPPVDRIIEVRPQERDVPSFPDRIKAGEKPSKNQFGDQDG